MRSFKTLLFALVILWSGCGDLYDEALKLNPPVPYYTFSLSFAPKVFLRPDTNTILLINRVDLSKLKAPDPNQDVIKAGAFTAVKYAGVQLAMLPHVHVINLTDSVDFVSSTDSVAVLSAKYHADYTLALVRYNADVSPEGTYRTRAYFNNKVNLQFTMYMGKGDLYKELPGSDTSRSIQHEFGVEVNDLIPPTIGGSKDFIIGATQDATFAALIDYLAYTQSESRPLYTNKRLAPIVDEITMGHLDRANSLLQPIIYDRDPVMAAQAAYNLAVVYEARGDIDSALSMAKLSVDKSRNRYARSMIRFLASK